MTTSVSKLMIESGQKARAASRRMAAASTADKNKALLRLAELLEAKKEDIFAANEQDLVRAKKNGLKESFVDRLRVTEKVLRLMAEGARQTAALPDPVGEISEMRRRPSGIQVGRMRVPLGVLGIIYESRPNVTVDAACLAVKSGNDPKTGRAYTPLVRMLYNEQEIAFRSECTPIADGSTWYKLTELKSCLASDHQTLGDDAHLTDDSTTQPGTGPNTGEGTSTTPNNNGAGTHQPSNTQANGTENELSRTGVAVTGVAGIMMLLALAGISLNLWKVRR